MVEKIVYLFLLFSLLLGVIPNALLFNFTGTQISFYFFDIAIFAAFCLSIFIKKHRNIGFDIFLVLVTFYLLIVLLINVKLLFLPSSLLYLVRFSFLGLSYPFFLHFFTKYIHFAVKTLNLFLLVALIFYLLVFYFFPNVTVIGFDPHVNRLYGMFIDPNFYSVFVCLVFFYVLPVLSNNFGARRQGSSVYLTKGITSELILGYLTIALCLVSLFLTFSRLGILVFFIITVVLFLKNKSPFILGLFSGFLILVLTNISYLYRILFIGGNLDSFIFKIISFVEGLYLINLQPVPTGFNNVTVYRYFLMSNINNVTSFFDFSPFTFILSGGLIFAGVFSLLIIYLIKLNSNSKLLIFLFLISGFVMNTTFNPILLILLISLVAGLEIPYKQKS